MNWQRFAGKCLAGWYTIRSMTSPSFSQAGEDQLLRFLMYGCLGITKPSYIDIGANHPISGNNTFYFYLRGSKGVCIEPDIQFYNLLKKHRKRDVVLHAGVGVGPEREAVLYAFPENSGWNTFSKEEADKRAQESGLRYHEMERIRLVNINEVIEQHFNGHPNIISIDAEGLDLAILKTLDFQRYRPEAICVESITFSVTNEEQKLSEILEFLASKGYFVFGDTHVNTIFCRTDVYKKTQA